MNNEFPNDSFFRASVLAEISLGRVGEPMDKEKI